MGFAGYKGKVYFVADSCPVDLDGTPPEAASDEAGQIPDEVTKFVIVESANKREYGHDKSHGFQDVCYGIRKLEITIDAVCRDQTANYFVPGHAGTIVWLELEPFGACGARMTGYAGVDRVSYTVDQERGEPVAYTMTLSSKGRWNGIPQHPWGGFECSCSGDGQSSDM